MPKLGLTMEEGAVTGWLAHDGARVSAGQPICEIETEKVTEEIVAEADGVLKHAAGIGETVAAGRVIGYID